MQIDVFTIFPGLVDTFCTEGLLGKARANHLLDLRTHDLREHTTDVHRTVDDAPFGGGAGMVMKAEPIFASVEAAGPPRPLMQIRSNEPVIAAKPVAQTTASTGYSMPLATIAFCVNRSIGLEDISTSDT